MRRLAKARAANAGPATFLLDEVLELRTFESFPGLRHVLRDLIEALSGSGNRFVLTTRYSARAHRLLRDATARFEVMHIPALSPGDVIDLLAPGFSKDPGRFTLAVDLSRITFPYLLLVSLVTLYGVRLAATPADHDHRGSRRLHVQDGPQSDRCVGGGG